MKCILPLVLSLIFLVSCGKGDQPAPALPDNFQLTAGTAITLKYEEDSERVLSFSDNGKYLLTITSGQDTPFRIHTYEEQGGEYAYLHYIDTDFFPLYNGSMAWSHSGEAVAIATRGTQDDGIYLLYPASAELTPVVGDAGKKSYTTFYYSSAWSEDDSMLYYNEFVSDRNRIQAFDLSTGKTNVVYSQKNLFGDTILVQGDTLYFTIIGFSGHNGIYRTGEKRPEKLRSPDDHPDLDYMYHSYKLMELSADGSKLLYHYPATDVEDVSLCSTIVCLDTQTLEPLMTWREPLPTGEYLANAMFDPTGDGVLLFCTDGPGGNAHIYHQVLDGTLEPRLVYSGQNPDGGFSAFPEHSRYSFARTKWMGNGSIAVNNLPQLLIVDK